MHTNNITACLTACLNFALLKKQKSVRKYSPSWIYMNVQYNDPFAVCTKSHLNFFPFFSGFVTENQLPHKIQYISWSPVGHKLVSKDNEALEWFCFVWLEDIYLPLVIILLGNIFDRPVCINLGCQQEWQRKQF